jgi:hypothetical protein
MSPVPALGVARLARFRADGLASFDATRQGLLNALAPWLGFAVVGAVLGLAGGSAQAALGGLLSCLVGLMAPLVLSESLARMWGAAAGWLRYSVAFMWCQWIMLPAVLVAMLGAGALVALGLPGAAAELLAGLALLCYALALNLFVARRALLLSLPRALMLVVAVNLGTALLALGPTVLAGLLNEEPVALP